MRRTASSLRATASSILLRASIPPLRVNILRSKVVTDSPRLDNIPPSKAATTNLHLDNTPLRAAISSLPLPLSRHMAVTTSSLRRASTAHHHRLSNMASLQLRTALPRALPRSSMAPRPLNTTALRRLQRSVTARLRSFSGTRLLMLKPCARQ